MQAYEYYYVLNSCVLRSVTVIGDTCLVKRSRNQFGDRCFATAGPTLWNNLPWTALATKHHLCTVQMIVENVYVWVSWAAAPCIWTLRALARNVLTYLHESFLLLTYWTDRCSPVQRAALSSYTASLNSFIFLTYRSTDELQSVVLML